jgi:site-specific recombinase XerD
MTQCAVAQPGNPVMLRDIGMRIAELCGMRLYDVDRRAEILRVWGIEGTERSVMLSANGSFQLLTYVGQYHPKYTTQTAHRYPHFVHVLSSLKASGNVESSVRATASSAVKKVA